MMNSAYLPERLQKLIDIGESGTNILHGQLKVLMLEAEEQLALAQEEEDRTEEAMDSMERKYWEGVLDALGDVYALTYQLAFAIDERTKKNENRIS
jgi:hypothetical protein